MDRSFHILILEERGANTELLTNTLPKEGARFYLHHTTTDSEFRRQLRGFVPDLIIASHFPPYCDAMTALAAARRKGGQLPFIVVCAARDEGLALEAVREGATSYVLRERIEDLTLAVCRALRQFDGDLEGQATAMAGAERAPLGPECDKIGPEEKIPEQARMLDQAHEAVIAWDLEGTIVYWNQSAVRLYGWVADEAIGQRVELLLRQDLAATSESDQAVSKLEHWSGELTQSAKGGQKLLVESRQTLIRDGAGKAKRVLAINIDKTAHKKAGDPSLRSGNVDVRTNSVLTGAP
jgi:PAS domain S-box-containing protein